MGFSVTYPTLSDPIDRSEIETNFSDITGKSGAIVSADISPSAGITTAQLSHFLIEVWITLTVRASDFAAGWTNAVNGGILDVVPFPGQNNDESWQVVHRSWACTDVGNGTAAYSVQFGTLTSGSWVNTTTLESSTIATGAGGADGNNALVRLEGPYSTGTALVTSNNPDAIALLATNVQAATLSAAGSFFNYTVGMRRKLQSE